MKVSAFLFPGQGSQYVGMGKELYNQVPLIRNIFEQADEELGFNLTKLCFQGGESELKKTENAQPALLTVSYAMFKFYMQEYGLSPMYLAGQSLGEITALTCAGAIDFTDAIKLVRQRGKFMREAVDPNLGAMAAVIGLEYDIVQQVCNLNKNENEIVVISNYNSPDTLVVSGHKLAVGRVSEHLKSLGATVVPLHVSAPFHSPLMEPAAQKFEIELQKYNFKDLTWTVISNVNGLPYQKKSEIIPNLKAQMVNQVKWKATMEYLSHKGVELAIEFGPRMVLRNLMKQNHPKIECYAYDDPQDLSYISIHLKKRTLDRANKMKVLTRCMAIAVCTRNHNDDNEDYQKGAVVNYKKIESIVEKLESKNDEPTVKQLKEALEMLRIIFNTKHTSLNEQKQRFEQIFNETSTRELFADFIMPNEYQGE